MRYLYLFIFCLFWHESVHAQTYSYDEVMAKAGKALQQVIPAHLIPATQVHYSPYYLSLMPEEEWQLLENGKKTKGKLKTLNIRYRLELKHTTCPEYGEVTSIIELELNEQLELESYKIVDPIPEFVLQNLPCPFISKADAVRIAAKHNVHAEESRFRFSRRSKNGAIYYVHGNSSSYFENGPGSKEIFETELLEIDAETGEVVSNSFKQDKN